MTGALTVGALVFAVGALWKLVLIAWLGIVAGVMAVAGSILVRTGGLEPHTFGTCLIAAIVLDAVLLLGIFAALVATHVKPQLTSGRGGAYLRRPARVTAMVLAVALLAVTAAGWRRSPYFPYPIATIVVLASAYYLLLLVVLNTGTVLYRLWPRLHSWGHSTPYRMGLLTATLLLLGFGGIALGEVDWAPNPRDRLFEHLGLARVAGGLADAQLAELCIGADEVAPRLASAAAAPGCRVPGSAEGSAQGLLGSSGDCFTTLEAEVAGAQRLLISKLELSDHDANNIAMEALLKTCTREPLPENLRAYFFKVVRNQGVQAAIFMRRTITCDDLEERAPATCSTEQAEYRETELALVWKYARCVLSDQQASVLQSRLVDGLSFREIGARENLGEDDARYAFHNAIKKLRRGLGDCLR
jgi:DNA-directed RNA polymerase specialized sigma24 family protein